MSDEDAARYIKIFTFLGKEEIEDLVAQQAAAAHLRPLQRRLAEELTVLVHSREDYDAAVSASEILFGNGTADALRSLDEEMLLSVMEGVPHFSIARDTLATQPKAVDLFTEGAAIFPSKGELRKLIKSGGVSLNKTKLTDTEATVSASDLIAGRYLLVQRGKKQYYLVTAE